MPIVFTGGQVLPDTKCPTLITWIWDEDHALLGPSESGDTLVPIVPRYEEGWLKKPSQEWYGQGLLDKMALSPMPCVRDTTMLIVNGPQTNLLGIDNYFDAVAGATEQVASWRASDSELQEWAERLADITPPLTRRTKALVRWIAAMNHLANQ